MGEELDFDKSYWTDVLKDLIKERDSGLSKDDGAHDDGDTDKKRIDDVWKDILSSKYSRDKEREISPLRHISSDNFKKAVLDSQWGNTTNEFNIGVDEIINEIITNITFYKGSPLV